MIDELPDNFYVSFRDLLHRRCGLYYPESKRHDLAHSLRHMMRERNYTDLSSLYSAVVAGGAAWDALVAHVTIGETYFFRNSSQFDALRQRILPDVLSRRASTRMVRLWSAGCATGEEPYSLAMLMDELVLAKNGWQMSLLATDLNLDFLARAREGLYGTWSFRETSDEVRARYFEAEGPRWRLRPEIRRQVQFSRLNLVEDEYPSIVNGTWALDIILCRNVTIYFDTETTKQVVSRLYNALTPGGWLIVGHAEPQASTYQQFEVHNFPGTVVYRKPLGVPLFAVHQSSPSAPATIPPASLSTSGLPQPARRPAPQPISPRPAPAPASNPASYTAAPTVPARDPERAAACVDVGRAHADSGDMQQAELSCKEALEYDSLCWPAHYLLGQVYEQRGMLDEALSSYRRVVYLDRTLVVGMIGMAEVWRQLERAAEAQRWYRNALKQLTLMPPGAVIPAGDGATAEMVTAHIRQQLQQIGDEAIAS